MLVRRCQPGSSGFRSTVVASSVFLPLLVVGSTLLLAESGILAVNVRNAANDPLPKISIGTMGDGSTGVSDATGRARIRLPNQTQPGQTVTLQIISPANLFIVSPWDGQSVVPSFDNSPDNYVRVILIARGDRRALESAAVVAAAVAASTTPQSPKPVPRGRLGGGGLVPVSWPPLAGQAKPAESLITEETAKAMGFTRAELDEALRRFTPDPVQWKLVTLTGLFETGRQDPFSTVTTFLPADGIAFGIGFWSIGRGTLQPILKQMRQADLERFDAIMGEDRGFVLEWLEAPPERGLALTRERMLRNEDGRPRIIETWKSRFIALGSVPAFQRVQLDALRPWLDGARKQTAELGLRSERALAFIYDLRYNQGPLRSSAIEADATDRRAFERRYGRPPDEQERLLIIANRALERVPSALKNAIARRRYAFALGRGELGGVTFDLDQAGFRMRDMVTGEAIRLSGDATALKQLQSGWIPGAS